MRASATERVERNPSRRRGRVIAVALAVGGFAGTLIVLDSAGAVSEHATVSTVIATSKSAKLGTILTSKGRTLYILNKKDCSAQCLTYWPPVTLATGATKAVAGGGVTASKLGKVKDARGSWQVTYGGKALYWFAQDKAAGQTKGNQVNDQWGLWSVIVTVKPTGTTPTTTTTAPGGGGVSF